MVSRIARQLGIGEQTLRNWVERAEIDTGKRPGTSTEDKTRIAELEKEVRELRRAVEGPRARPCPHRSVTIEWQAEVQTACRRNGGRDRIGSRNLQERTHRCEHRTTGAPKTRAHGRRHHGDGRGPGCLYIGDLCIDGQRDHHLKQTANIFYRLIIIC